MEERILEILPQTWWEKLLGQLTVVYMDTEELYLDKEFTNYKVRKEFFSKIDKSYNLRVLRIPKKLLEEFKIATSNVRNKALICGYTKFDEIYNITKGLLGEK